MTAQIEILPEEPVITYTIVTCEEGTYTTFETRGSLYDLEFKKWRDAHEKFH